MKLLKGHKTSDVQFAALSSCTVGLFLFAYSTIVYPTSEIYFAFARFFGVLIFTALSFWGISRAVKEDKAIVCLWRNQLRQIETSGLSSEALEVAVRAFKSVPGVYASEQRADIVRLATLIVEAEKRSPRF